jgi:hypothetical protein
MEKVSRGLKTSNRTYGGRRYGKSRAVTSDCADEGRSELLLEEGAAVVSERTLLLAVLLLLLDTSPAGLRVEGVIFLIFIL